MSKEIGQIKWYGGFNSKTGRYNEYGFISHLTMVDDLYFHKKSIKFNESHIKISILVTFEVKTFKDKNGIIKTQAVEIDLIENEDSLEVVQELCKCIHDYYQHGQETTIWQLLPNKFLKFKEIYDLAPNKVKFDYLIKTVDKNNLTASEINELVNLLPTLDKQDSQSIISILPSQFQAEPNIFKFLTPKDQVEVIWDKFCLDPISIWSLISRETKVFILYKSIQENFDLNILVNKIDFKDDPLISFVLQIFYYPQISFIKIHASLIQLILSVNGNTALLFPLFREENLIFNFFDDMGEDGTYNKIWSQWGIQELLLAKNIKISFPKITLNINSYIRKIKAWANFVSINFSRLKCRYCNNLMTFNPEYSKHSYVHELTLFWCPHAEPVKCLGASRLDGSNHNYNVYINHCWNCQKTVDSRDSLEHYGLHEYTDDGWVKCINCGAGKMRGRFY